MRSISRGFSLLEVLIAVLVVSFGLLGVAATLLLGTHSANSNYSKQQVVQYAYDIIDRMRANRATAIGGTTSATNPYVISSTTTPSTPTSCMAATCSGTAMAAYDIWQWRNNLSTSLPSGLGSVAVAAGSNSTYNVTVTVSWSDKTANQSFNAAPASASTAANTYTVTTAL